MFASIRFCFGFMAGCDMISIWLVTATILLVITVIECQLLSWTLQFFFLNYLYYIIVMSIFFTLFPPDTMPLFFLHYLDNIILIFVLYIARIQINTSLRKKE